jgi:transposase InsO family protein
VPKLADEGIYIASESSFYRVLKSAKQLTRRGKQRIPTHKAPKFYVARGPNQVWSWDISYLPTIVGGLFYFLYFFMDIYSRKIVGYGVYNSEKASHAIEVLLQAYKNENIKKRQIVLHSDNGSPMKASTFKETLKYLGVTTSYNRPSVSNDNPYSEALFKTTKYCPWYPKEPFKSLQEAKDWVDKFVKWYNYQHLHSGLKYITPEIRHRKKDNEIIEKRIRVYEDANNKNPNRWIKGTRNWMLPTEVYLNRANQIAQNDKQI